MHRSEEPEHEPCTVCGADVVVGTDRAYIVTDEEIVCFACALRLGGSWDEITGTWLRPPDLTNAPLVRDHAHR